MPQLDPTPWFSILIISWLILIVFSPKVLKYLDLNDPNPQTYKGLNKPWLWPWP